MLTPKEYADIINRELAGLNLPDNLPGLYEPVRYALASGGKRIRPVLLLMAAQAFGAEIESALWPALGVEIFHNFTLLHDDVMDHAAMRRGRPTVCARWDTNTAILSGDAMTTLAYKCVSGCEPQFLPEVIDRFSMMTMAVYEGQQLDADMQQAPRATFSQYLNMVTCKTSALIAYPCAIGTLLAGADGADIEAMFNYGISLGIAFQMMDDWLDVYGDPATFGKAIGGDIIEGKRTWLHIIATDRGVMTDRAEGQTDDDRIREVTDIYDRIGLREAGDRLIAQYTSDAVDAVNATSLNREDKDAFIGFAKNLVHRDV